MTDVPRICVESGRRSGIVYAVANIVIRPPWHVAEREVTPEKVYATRRTFLRQMGFCGSALMAWAGAGCSPDGTNPMTGEAVAAQPAAGKGYPYPRNQAYNPGWPLSHQRTVETYNNFYEFSTTKERVHQLVDKFVISPWEIEIGGLCEKPFKADVRELVDAMPMEERVYRFRCVEGWAMIVPWTGFPLSMLIDKAQPKSGARFAKFTTAMLPDQMPGISRLRGYPWPYTEGLRLDEAMHELVLVTTGVYGKTLPKQMGAPIRIVVPWKYGYKSIKSVVKMDFVATQPQTLWETLAPDEYPFESNVNPRVPHPRWSQATERMIDSGDRVRTVPFNGYGEQVAALYNGTTR